MRRVFRILPECLVFVVGLTLFGSGAVALAHLGRSSAAGEEDIAGGLCPPSVAEMIGIDSEAVSRSLALSGVGAVAMMFSVLSLRQQTGPR